MAQQVAAGAIGLAVAACAGTHQVAPFADTSKPVAADKTRVYVIRPYRYVGSALGLEIRDSGKTVGKLGVKGYLCWDRDPGKTIIGSENSAGVELDGQPGKTYYLRCRMEAGCLTPHQDIVQLSEDQAETLLKKAHPPR